MREFEDWRTPATGDLLDAILALPDRDEAERFLRDLCTLREIHDLAQRWQVVRLLQEGLHYAEISGRTGASTATITRIAPRLHPRAGGRRGRPGADEGPGGHGDRSMTPDRLRLAVPNKGRLLEPTLRLLRDAGLEFEDQSRALVSHAENVPLDLLPVRTEDIVELVGDGVADLGITGTNLLAEADVELPVRLELGYGRCRLEAAVPVDDEAVSFEQLAGRALLVGRPSTGARRDATVDEVVTVLGAVVAGRRRKYLMMNAPRRALSAIEAILPGPASPSATPLAHDDMVAVHAVV